MRKYIFLLGLYFGSFSVWGQNYTYTLDPADFLILNETSGDSILWLTESNNWRSQRSFRIEKSSTVGSIRMRAIDNPEINIFDANGAHNVHIASELNGSGGAILLSDLVNGDTNSIRLVTNFSGTGDARIVTDELQINGGADLAEMFDISGGDLTVEPGMLVSIDPSTPGKLRITDKMRDRKVAGIVAGANGIKPGILMGQDGTEAFGDQLVTLNGRTYVKANHLAGRIQVGDFLSSSKVPGEAMRVKNVRRARGSIIGKAMSELDENGFVLVLVSLQ